MSPESANDAAALPVNGDSMRPRADESGAGQVMAPAVPTEPARSPTTRLAVAPIGRPSLTRHWYRRPPFWLAGLLVGVVFAAAIVVLLAGRLAGPAQVPVEQPTAAPAPLTAHGVVEPVVRARVGTQGAGVVRALSVAAGMKVEGQQELAVVQGPSGAEVLTAPFAGTVTDVLVHLGDT